MMFLNDSIVAHYGEEKHKHIVFNHDFFMISISYTKSSDKRKYFCDNFTSMILIQGP